MVKKSLLENKKRLAAIIGVAVMVVGGSVFGIYKLNAAQVEQVAEAQETIDVDALAETYYNENKDNIKSDTTLEDWKTVFKEYWATTNGDEAATVRDCLNYFALDTLTAEDVDDPSTMSVSVDEDVKAIVDAEVHGNDEATDEATAEESVETVEVEASEATAEASTTEVSTDTVKQDKHDYEIEYKDTPETMYAVKGVNIRKGPATDYDKVKVLKVNEKIEVIGLVTEVDGEDTYWVVYKDKDGNEVFVSGAYVDTKPITQTSSSSGSGSNNTSSGSNNNTQSSGSQQSSGGQQSSGNSSAWDILNGNVNHDYSTSGTIETGKVTEGANWAP